ncbi:hypothetical protein TBLA_0B07900 [Henningerozyma blattae CBS 6284]|uniref:Copper transport protein n=1 Tax=Henningerozyma blattae (strain ATCC 34711 / CBS 6284 / DSM 70876 / NBRC 10599 / NRRL Y-10934 / UCD 77-7) TaxID=1071380 RepID=I2GZQ4_HENB6|nr:hypothetical protein TBLA_0B07900 [Tetrapisispora blattae CBS 6284]CCH59606.1 hypothetical protein TBLA_0B07900 [Tetrapisispora blattae CBS 6284]
MSHNHNSTTCEMNSVITFKYENTCVLIQQWQITSLWQLLISSVFICFLGYFYEYLRYRITIFKDSVKEVGELLLPGINSEVPNFLTHTRISKKNKFKLSLLYGLEVLISLLLMLIFMTYNFWLMCSVVLGAILGNYQFQAGSKDYVKPICH